MFEYASPSLGAARIAKRFAFPGRLGREAVARGRRDGERGRACGAADAEATLSHERGSFDLIIWEGQSAFVDEESL